AFTSYFDYDPSILEYKHSNDYDVDGWVSLLKTELDNGRPVLYAGYSESALTNWSECWT
ncbi:MAG: C10 family peptidase, partial [Spirochaetales bacterium]|nr:C10 family peptidase [Spirochaetales bacterium]